LDFGKEIGTFLQGYIEYFVNLQHQNTDYKNTDQIEFLFPFGSDNNQSCVTKRELWQGSASISVLRASIGLNTR
jgi:hypothetical protein